MLEVTNLDFDYQNQPLLNNVTFRVSAGGLVHLRGTNGAGKTTLLKLIAGLYQPVQGNIRFLEKNIKEDLPAYQRQLCFVGHKAGINPHLSLRENCLYDLHYSSLSHPKAEVDELACIFKLERHLDIPCGLLSAGQRRQAGLLRLWMTQAKLWLLDEPLVALDEGAVKRIMDKIESHRNQGGAVLLTSHQPLPLNGSLCEEYSL